MSELLDKIKHPKKRAFLSAFAELGAVGLASESAKVSRMNHYSWLRAEGSDGDDYRAAFAEARECACDNLEAEALRRAKDGVRRLKFHEGMAVIDPETGEPYVEHQFSDTLAIFLLKAMRPEKYRERVDTQVSGSVAISGTVTVQHVLDEIGDDETFQEFCRTRVSSGNAGLLCGNGKSGSLEDGAASGAHRPGRNGHNHGKNGKHSGD